MSETDKLWAQMMPALQDGLAKFTITHKPITMSRTPPYVTTGLDATELLGIIRTVFDRGFTFGERVGRQLGRRGVLLTLIDAPYIWDEHADAAIFALQYIHKILEADEAAI